MADFCKQCSIDVFGEDYRDLAGLMMDEDADKGYVYHVLCEDCGPNCVVDNQGVCQSRTCLKQHGECDAQG